MYKTNGLVKKLMVGAISAGMLVGTAVADKLDDVLQRGEVRCAVVLDFPPMGFRDQNNNPVGMDVDMCADLAAAMGVDYQIVGVTWAERIPALITGRVDVAIASTSDTLERAQTVGFTIPYMVFQFQALLPADSDITTWEDLRDARVGAAVGTTYESEFLAYKEANWGDDSGRYLSFQSENESFLAVSQGQVDAVIVTDTAAANVIESGRFGDLKLGPVAPFGADVVGMITLRQEYGWINYLNLFINRQVRSGRYEELYSEWIGGQAPSLVTPNVYY
ncbi:transporter substrate-binding domain-containing protein [Salinispirillum marinum]|uniref:Transporter substrate-binding domain-containing protein n=2 Tax=Saccharospirillaceae TaxID=255527 RepID=A0ABV8BAJ6_9GAMM